MSWKQSVKNLQLSNEEKFFDLLKRTPCDPVFYLLKVEEKVKVEAITYYKILMEKYKEEKEKKLYNMAYEFAYLLRDNRNELKGENIDEF